MSGLAHWLATAIDVYVLHPLKGAGYQWWSGGGSDLSEITLAGIALGWWRHRNCEQPRCLRLGHPHPDHGRPVCRRHFHHDVRPPERTKP